MDNYKIALGALLDANAKGDIDKQLNAIKDLSVTISKATLSNDVINDIKRQLTQNGIDLKLVFGNVNQITNQAKQTGQQIGQQIQNGINDAIQKGNLQKDFFFSADKKNGVAKQAQEYFRGISNGVVTVTEQMENLDDKSELRGFIVNIKNAKGEVESLKYSLRNILDDNGNVTGQKFAYVSGSINDANAIKQFKELNKVITDYEIKLANLKTKYSNANVDYTGFDGVFENFKLGITTTNELALAFNQLENSAKKGVQSLKSQSSSFDPIQQTLNNMRDLPSMLTALEANMSGVKDKTNIAEISVDKLRESFDKLDAEMQANGGKVPITDEWLKNYRDLMSTVTSATKQVDALKKAEASDNSQTQKQANYYSTILSNYREIYSLKQKLLTAGKEETKVIQEQIRSLNSSNASINKQLGKQGLKDGNWQTQVDDLKEELDYSLRISKARQKDKANQSSLNNAQREAIQIVEELEQAYQRVQDIKIKIASLDKVKDGEKISTLSQEEESAQAEYKQLYERLRKRKNYDKESWNETKTAIDSATQSQIEYNNAASQDTLNKVQKAEIANFRILKDKWDKQGLLVDEFKAKVEAMESSLSSVGSKGGLDNLKIDIKDLRQEASQLLEANKAYEKAEKELTATLEKRRVAQANSAKEKAKSTAQQELVQQREVNAILSKQESAYKEIWNINKQIANLDTTEDADVIGVLNEKKKFYQDIYLSAQKELQAYNNIVVSQEHLTSLAEIRKKAESEIGVTVAKQNKALADEVNKIQHSLSVGDYDAQIETVKKGFISLSGSADEAETHVQGLRTALKAMHDATDDNGRLTAEKSYQLELEKTNNQLTIARAKAKEYVDVLKVNKLRNDIQDWLKKNTAATKEAKDAMLSYLNMLDGDKVTPIDFNTVKSGFDNWDTRMRQAGKLGKSLTETFKEGAKSFAQWTVSSGAVMEVWNSFKTGIKTVVELDTAMVDLQKTANMSAQELENFYYTSNDVAEQMGVTTKEIIDQASAWSRLGYNTAEMATQMAKLSSQFKLISPGMTTDEATDGLVSIMKAYDVDVNNVLDGIMSKVNIIGNKFALSNSDIIAMLQDSVSAMAEGNNTLEETIALETAAFEIAQDRSVGNGFKTVALRLRGINEETQELDDSLKTVSGDLYDLTGVSVMQDANTYKSTYQILKDINEVWDSLSDKTQAEALELMFGKQRANVGAAVLKNFEAAERAMEEMANSAGNAEAEMAIAMDSVEYKLNILGETGTAVSQNLFNREDMKTVLDGINILGGAVEWLTDKLGLFGTASLIGGGILGGKNLGKFA